MFKNLKKRSEGFTIIEVMIVLAIGGLIMLIVFLAVPSLQRSQRNTNRNNDATRWAAAVTECLANHNNVTTTCNTTGSAVQGAAQLTVNSTTSAAGVTSPTPTSGSTPNIINASSTSVAILFAATCVADGTSAQNTTTSPTSFVVLYALETSTAATQSRCLGS